MAEVMTTTTPEVGGMGHSVKRKEDPRFIRGKGEYIDDVNLPGQLWLDIVRSPYAHATIKGIDTSEALKVPGVLAIVTGKDLEGYKLHWMPTLAGDMQMVLPTDTVMYQSQEVAAVIATCGCVADWDPIRQQLTLHMTSQAPHAIRTVLALVAAGAGLPISEQNIRVKTHDIGGGFGGKVPVYPGYVLAVAASFLIGKPVKWIADRSANLQADSFARDHHIHA